jgi:hypothetical protein
MQLANNPACDLLAQSIPDAILETDFDSVDHSFPNLSFLLR